MSLGTFGLFAAGFVLLILGAELLVRGASRLARAAGISPLVVGLTVVAYGTSAPEVAVTVQANYAVPPQPDLAIGNVVGSNIANVLLVLGISAAAAPLVVSRQLVRRSVPLMIALSAVVYGVGMDGLISRLEGLTLFVGSILFTILSIRGSRAELAERRPEDEQQRTEKRRVARQLMLELGLIIAGLILLLMGANWLVDAAVVVAEILGVDELVIGLTIVAVGTSLPEIATSVVAGLRRQRDIAVGNVVGSNIFNILLVLGISATTAPAELRVSPAALRFDIPVMIAVAAACLPVFFSGYRISRWEGLVFLGYYAAYNVYLFMDATGHQSLDAFNSVMLTFVLPLTTITILVLTGRALRSNVSTEKEPSR